MNDNPMGEHPLSGEVRRAAEIIRRGGIVAYPTETYYGLAVDPFNPAALRRLFQMKQRSPDKPVLTLIAQCSQLSLVARQIPDIYEPLWVRFWPGPLSLVFPAHDRLPDLMTGGTGTVGVRISSHPVARFLVEAAAGPITATSANLSGRPAAVNADQVRNQLGDSLDMIIDGGETPGGMGSTVVGCSDPVGDGCRLQLLRAGVIPFDKISGAGHADVE